MRCLFLVAGIFLLINSINAQKYLDTHNPKDKEIKALLSKENELNGFGGADLKVTNVFKERALIVGAYGGVLVNRNYMLGIAGYGIATNPEFEGLLPDGTEKKLNIHGGYGGLLIGATVLTKEVVHLHIPILLGAGSVQITDEDFFQNSTDTDFTIESSTFFVVEPAAELEFNITRTLRLAAGASYRYIRATELDNLTDENLTDWTGMLTLRFGRF